MKKKHILYVTFCSLIFFTVACITFAGKGVIPVTKNDCIKKYNITRGASPWQGFTSSHEDEEASKKIRALPLEGSDYKPVTSLEKYSRSGMIIVGRSEKLHRVAVEVSFFSDLRRADAAGSTPGRILVGTCKAALFRIFTCAEIAEFLIESQIVNTFWHVEADFCLVKEDDTESSYMAHYKGKHIYFTNSKNEDPLDFSIIIDKRTGDMFVEAK